MNTIERALRTKNLLWYNFFMWLILCLIEIIKTISVSQSFSIEIELQWIIRWPISAYLTYWILSFFVFQLYASFRYLKSLRFFAFHGFSSLVFAIIHKVTSPIVGLLLERLFLGQETLPLDRVLTQIQHNWLELIVGITVYWALIIVLSGINFYRKFQDEHNKGLDLETQLVRSQLQSMKMQLHPHFLFNALNTISMMVRKEKKSEAVEMISNLGDMLRQSLTKEKRQFIALGDELILLKKYLSIETIRYKDRLDVEMNIDESLNNCLVPNLILQPIVENAFKHGISKNLGTSILRISTYKQDNKLHLSVFNSGSALPVGWEFHKNKGIGLLNTSTRLLKLYEDNVKFLINEKEDGVSVEIILPMKS